jgi:ABC-type glycerol-3-phosphate transport system substrate-binding protein
MEPDQRPVRPFPMGGLSMRVTVGLAACAIVFTGCGTSSTTAAESATKPTASESESPPPLRCKLVYQVILDHFGLGKGEDSPEEAVARYRAPGSRVVVEETGDTATLYVASADGDETVAIIQASNYGNGWLTDNVRSCHGYAFHMDKGPARPGR